VSQQKNAFLKPFLGVIAILVVISVVLFIIARSFSNGPTAEQAQAPDSRMQAAVEQRLKSFGDVNVGGAAPQQAAAGGAQRSPQQIVENTCAACHASGTLGAPVIGTQGDWSARLDKGADSLVKNAMNGLNAMPPKGGDASLSEAELKGAIGYMLAESGLKDPYAGNGGAQASAKQPADAGAQPAAKENGTAAGGGDLAKGEQVHQATCFACHGTGAAGAPKTGDAGAWKDRIAKGKDTLYTHALEGFQGDAGFMPAKGGNPALSDEDVKAAVDYMVSQAQ